MSTHIFQYLINATAEQQTDMGVTITEGVQDEYRDKLQHQPNTKLDDLGDAFLHAISGVMVRSNYQQMVPPNTSLQCNRTIMLAVTWTHSYWSILNVTGNRYLLEALGYFENHLQGVTYSDPSTLQNAHGNIIDKHERILCRAVDRIKITVK
jgi:hypothetical protein